MNQRPESSTRTMVSIVSLAVLIGTLVTACNHEPNVTELEYPGTEGGTIYFLTQSDSGNSHTAELSGELRLVDGCLEIAHDAPPVAEPMTIVWPEGFEIAVDDDTVLILDDDRRVVTRVGERTSLGGSGRRDDDRLGGCDGPFWSAGPIVRSGDEVSTQ